MNTLETLGLTVESVQALSRITALPAMPVPVPVIQERRRYQHRDGHQMDALCALAVVDGMPTSGIALRVGGDRAARYVMRRLQARGLARMIRRGRGGRCPIETVWGITFRGEAAVAAGDIHTTAGIPGFRRSARRRPAMASLRSVRNLVRHYLQEAPRTSAQVGALIGRDSEYASAVCIQLEARGEVERVLLSGSPKMHWRLTSVNWKEETHA